MELAVGEHCQLSTCHRLDFLPLGCRYCQRTFCSEHWTAESHDCTGISREERRARLHGRIAHVVQCPICQEPVAVQNDAADAEVSIDRVVGRHIDETCFGRLSSEREKTRFRKCLGQLCCARGCLVKTSTTGLQCPACSRLTCPKHRRPEDHPCLMPSPKAGKDAPGGELPSRPNASWLVQAKGLLSRPGTESVREPVKSTRNDLSWDLTLPGLGSTERHKQAERRSTIRALEARKMKGILSKEDEVRLARARAMNPNEACVIG